MRVLLVHEYYQQRGGEDVAFETDVELLEAAGHEVESLTFHNSEINDARSPLDRLRMFKTTIWSDEAPRRLVARVDEFEPDVVHFHNTFPLVSPSAFQAARGGNAAVVATLHNYRLICANASLYRDGRVCEDCVRLPAPLPGVVHGCYRDSRSQSAAVMGMLLFHRARSTWEKDVHRLISPSLFLKSKLMEAGFPESLIAVRPNAVADPARLGRPHLRANGGYFLYAGRLAPNKGIGTLLDAWQQAPDLPPLHIAGDGELAASVRERAACMADRVQYLGPLSREAVFQEMAGAQALVFPSVWYENQPMTILEAYALGTPVIASRLGAIRELVAERETGLAFQAGHPQELADQVRWCVEHPTEMQRMGSNARRFYEQHASPEVSLASLLDIYQSAASIAGPTRALVPA